MYLVTGGSGFIGSHVVERLVSLGKKVTVFDNLSTGNITNMKGVLDKITFIEADVRNLNALKKAAKKCTYIIHLAAIPSVPESIVRPALTHEVNLTGTLNALLTAKETGVKRFVYASSAAIYGDQFQEKQKKETMLPCPLSPYAAQKLAGEFYLKNFFDNFGLETVSLRFFNIFGPRQDPKSQYSGVISIFLGRMLQNLSPVIEGDGMQTRDFTYVANVVDSVLFACESDAKKIAGKTFNIGSGKPTNLLTLIDEMSRVLGIQAKPEFSEPRKGDIKHSCADIDLAKKFLGYMPSTTLSQGLEKTIRYYQEIIRS